jgi:hypothetical protein
LIQAGLPQGGKIEIADKSDEEDSSEYSCPQTGTLCGNRRTSGQTVDAQPPKTLQNDFGFQRRCGTAHKETAHQKQATTWAKIEFEETTAARNRKKNKDRNEPADPPRKLSPKAA